MIFSFVVDCVPAETVTVHIFFSYHSKITSTGKKFQLRVYLRTHALEQMVQAANSSAGLRTIKRVDQTLQDLGVCFLLGSYLTVYFKLEIWTSMTAKFCNEVKFVFVLFSYNLRFKFCSVFFFLKVHLKPKVPTKSVCAEHLELRKEILTLLNLQKQVLTNY